MTQHELLLTVTTVSVGFETEFLHCVLCLFE